MEILGREFVVQCGGLPLLCKDFKLLCKDFKLLRVLQLDNYIFSFKISKAIGDLVHLRYLRFRNSDFMVVQSSLSNSKFLRMLDLMVKFFIKLTIPDALWS